jgi:hypothetical protein
LISDLLLPFRFSPSDLSIIGLLFTIVDLRRGSASKHDRFPMRTSVFGYMVF